MITSSFRLIVACFFATTSSSLEQRTALRYDQVNVSQPFTGFYSAESWGGITNRDAALEFKYIPVSDVMIGPTDDVFDWDNGLEPYLVAAASRRRNLVVRFWVDYPTMTTGVPQFLVDAGLQFNSYEEHGGGSSPDYGDERLIALLETFIGAFGARYANDTRVGVVQVGLLGFWGEWHTWPHHTWFPSGATQCRIWDAYLGAFPETLLQQRSPVVAGGGCSGNVGQR